MSYNPQSAIFMRISDTDVSIVGSGSVNLDLGESVVGTTTYNSSQLNAHTPAHELFACADVIYTGASSGTQVQFLSEWSGSSGADDTGRQLSATSTSTVVARDELWGRGTAMTPQAIGLSLSNATAESGDTVVGGLIHD